MTADPSPIRDAARQANKAGLVPIPIRGDGSKAPDLQSWAEWQKTRPSNARLKSWFTDSTPGLGIICGAISGGLELLEFEACADIDQFQELITTAGLGDLFARIMGGYWGSSPSGGHHFPYHVENFTIPGNTKLARTQNAAGIHVIAETRGEGGYYVAAPSQGVCHPSGQPWTMILGGFDTIATITPEERSELHNVVRLLDEMPQNETTHPRKDGSFEQSSRPVDGDDTRPGDRLNDEGALGFAKLLYAHGWTLVHARPGIDYYRRPGKTVGISATVAQSPHAGRTGRHPTLKVFSSSTPFDTERTYDLLGALAVLEFNGDVSAAARSLVPEREPFHSDKNTTTPNGDEPEQLPSPWICWPEFWAHEHGGEEWAIYPLIPKGRGVALYAPAKAGKSTILLAAAAAAATGRPVFGNPPQPPIHVAYVDLEMTEADLEERLEELGYGPETNLDHLHYAVGHKWPPLDTQRGADELLNEVEAVKAEVVIVDTYGRAVQGDENDADTTRTFTRLTGDALKRAGIAWLRSDHSGKDLELGARGSSAKAGDVDVVWKLVRLDNAIAISLTHSRLTWVPPTINLEKREDDGGQIEYVTTNERGYAEGTKAVVEHLDKLDVPCTISSRKAQAILKEATGSGTRRQVLLDALRFRKTRSESAPILTGTGTIGYHSGTGGDRIAPSGALPADRTPPVKSLPPANEETF